MSAKEKTLCDWKPQQYVKELELLKSIVAKPAYVCTDCGRAASQKKWLCKPERL
jgi:lipopolysaccharide biosynthesis regulator YciM